MLIVFEFTHKSFYIPFCQIVRKLSKNVF